MRHHFNINTDNKLSHKEAWTRKTELIIALISVIFSISILLLYKGGVKVAENSDPVVFVQAIIFAFPFICIARLVYVRVSQPMAWFSWVSPIIDIAILSSIIYVFSWQYEAVAASYKAPTFSFYFVMIALHSMRFNPKQTLLSGVVAALFWAVMIASFKAGGAETTHSYTEFITSSKLLIGAEIERIIALLTFAGFLAIGAKRANRLMVREKKMEIEVAQINHQASLAKVQLEETKKTSQMKSDFLDTMSHEMRTPMNGVLGMIQVLEQTTLTEKQRYMLRVMDKSSEAMLKIIQDILDFATLNGNDINLRSDPFNLRDSVASGLKIAQQEAQDKGLDFFVQIDPTLPDVIMGDDHYFALIIEKLTSNAVKFTERGYIRLHIEDKYTNGKDIEQGGLIGITIHDTGIGMSETSQAAIFNAFSQADTSKSRAYGGMGIGLALVQKIMQALGAELKLMSTLGKGTCISFDLRWATPKIKDTLQSEAELKTVRRQSFEQDKIDPLSTKDNKRPLEAEQNHAPERDHFSDLTDILHELDKTGAIGTRDPSKIYPKKIA